MAPKPKILQQSAKPKILQDAPMGPLPMNKPSSEETLKQTILNAMAKKMGPDAMNKLLQPGDMGAEGAPGAPGVPPPDPSGMPPADASQFIDPNMPTASGAAPLPPDAPGGAAGVLARAVPLPPGMDINPADQGAPPAAEARFASGTAAMDRQIAENLANNRMQAKKLQASPQELLSAMPPGYSGQQPDAPIQAGRMATIQALLKSMGVQ